MTDWVVAHSKSYKELQLTFSACHLVINDQDNGKPNTSADDKKIHNKIGENLRGTKHFSSHNFSSC